ncbi:MAG: RidA family protein [Candidatus Pacebacteria bacterium]|nr:RidA family protein [Candidatus Paceibacterota bacterium]
MNRHAISSPHAPKAIGPYSQAIKHGNMIYCSGQLPLNPETLELVSGGIEAQTKQVMENIKAVLKEAGTNLDHVVKVTVYMQDLKEFSAMNAIYETYFKSPAPARSTVQIARLPKDALVEIEVLAAHP